MSIFSLGERTVQVKCCHEVEPEEDSGKGGTAIYLASINLRIAPYGTNSGKRTENFPWRLKWFTHQYTGCPEGEKEKKERERKKEERIDAHRYEGLALSTNPLGDICQWLCKKRSFSNKLSLAHTILSITPQ